MATEGASNTTQVTSNTTETLPNKKKKGKGFTLGIDFSRSNAYSVDDNDVVTPMKEQPRKKSSNRTRSVDSGNMYLERRRTSNLQQSLKRFVVAKEKAFGNSERILEVTNYGSVNVRKARLNEITFEVPDLSFFTAVPNSRQKVSLSWEGKNRVYKFKTGEEREIFLGMKNNDYATSACQNYSRQYFDITDPLRAERQLQQCVQVRCHREGSDIWHSGWLYFTNYRMLMVNKLDRESSEREENDMELHHGMPFVPAVSVPWLLIDEYVRSGDTISVTCKDLRSITYVFEEKLETVMATLGSYANPDNRVHVYCYDFFEQLIGDGKLKDLDFSGMDIKTVEDLKKNVEWKPQEDITINFRPSEKKDDISPKTKKRTKSIVEDARNNDNLTEFRGLILYPVNEAQVIVTEVKDDSQIPNQTMDPVGYTITKINGDSVEALASWEVIEKLAELDDVAIIDFSWHGLGDETFEYIRERRNDLDYRDQIMKKEYLRLLGTTQSVNPDFKINETSNSNYQLCRSYPPVILIPAHFANENLSDVAEFRSSGRIPGVVWVTPEGSVALARSSQPRTGMMNNRSEMDETYIKAVRLTNKLNSDRLVIIDCRPALNAAANKLQGKGYENAQNYEDCHLNFYDIENIHKMRSSLQHVKECSEHSSDDDWYSNLNSTKWLFHIKQVLACSMRAVTAIRDDKNSVLVHCSDGWDRTSQVSALAQIMLDPYFRTFEGFLVLIQKEWLWYGHMFASRCGLFTDEGMVQKRNQRSPIFLQFLDCVFQIKEQFPWAFEFNELLLLFIAEHFQSGRFGNFFGHNEQERDMMCIWLRTDCMFTYLTGKWTEDNYFRNPLYINQRDEYLTLRPSCFMRDIKFWTNYYCRWGMDDVDSWETIGGHLKMLNQMNTNVGVEESVRTSVSLGELCLDNENEETLTNTSVAINNKRTRRNANPEQMEALEEN